MSAQAETGGALVFLAAEAEFQLGVDYANWCPKEEKSKKVDDEAIWVVSGIMPGAHYVSWTSEERKNGMFVHMAPREVIVLKWDRKLELFLKMTDAEEVERFRLGHEDLSLLTRAVIFPKEWIEPWHQVSHCISSMVISQIQGVPLLTKDTKISEYSEEKDEPESKLADDTSERFDDRLSQLESLYRWTDIPKQQKTQASGLQGAELTNWAMDRSADLRDLIQDLKSKGSKYQQEEVALKADQLQLTVGEFLLLGEMQMAYIAFLLGCDLSALDHWKALLRLFTTSESIAEGSLGAEFIRCFYAQIDQCPDDLLQNELTSSNFIVAGLMSLSEITEGTKDPKIQRRMNLLLEKVKEKYRMSLAEVWALQEDGPQVVE